MPALVIKDIPRELHTKLKEAAARNRRSMTREAVALLEEGLRQTAEKDLLPPVIKGRSPVTKQFVDRAKRAGRL